MAWVKVESSVARHRKFQQAGPAASWLWVCSLCYCQEGLTDGFIPIEALPFLGIKSTAHLVKELVRVGLWDACEGGWKVHDYLAHNKAALDVRRVQIERRRAGARGGAASGEARRVTDVLTDEEVKQVASTLAEATAKQPSNPSTYTATETATATETESAPANTRPRRDLWFHQLLRDYPRERVTSGFLAQSAFNEQFDLDSRPEADVWADMRDGLDNQKAGHEWRVKGMTPMLDKWLREGRWRQRHEATPPMAERVTGRTSRTLQAAANIMKEPA